MVKNLLSLLSTRQTSILSGAAVLMTTVLASKILALVRDRLLAHAFSPDTVGVFLAAFRLPDLMFQVLIFGALSVAFIPVFTDYLHKRGEIEAFEFASDILNVVLVLFVLVSSVVFIFARPLTSLIVPGFTESQKQITTNLTQIILLGQILLAVGSFFAGIAQSYQRFIIPALAGVLYNLGIILGIVFLVKPYGIYGPAFGVIIGTALHVLVQLPLVASLGFKHRLNFNLKSWGVKEVTRLMSMRTIGVAVEQINETIGVVLASLISTASVTYLTFAQHLQTAPIGLFGATIAQAALPVLSREQARGEDASFKVTLLTTLHQILFLALPATAILIVLRIPAVRLVFGASRFDWEATVLTGRTLAFLSLGLASQAIVLLLVRGFYAMKDTKTPVIVSVVTVTLNIILSVVFVQVLHLEVWSLGLAYSVVSILSVTMLVWGLNKKVGGFNQYDLYVPFLKMLLASVVAAVALYIPVKAFDRLVFDTTRTVNLILLSGIAASFGLAVYVLLVWLMQVKELGTFVNLIKKVYFRQFGLKSEEIIQETTNPV
ncbi:murein biosynthesis integral membrane protein MurJ [Candidatus Daviesbacteria bacterium]|nr:murein biosynthesis integral membrane protein MurJ [Candidatus Daviesbacteria bacterium]